MPATAAATPSPWLGRIMAILRLGLGWIFLWAFLDKLLGLGFATAPDKSWLAGGSPTAGFLQFAATGPLAPVYQGLAGSMAVDVLFMGGLLFLGSALILGIARKPAALIGGLLMLLMYSALLLPKNNPLLDDHIIYLLVLAVLGLWPDRTWSLEGRWAGTRIVKRFPFLE